MISITDALNEVLEHYPFIEEGISLGIINYSSFARTVKPQIDKRLMKNVQTTAITMALTRIGKNLQKSTKNSKPGQLTNITVRSNLEEFTFANSRTLLDKQKFLFQKIQNQSDIVCSLSHGVRETTFIISNNLISDMKKIFKGEELIANIKNLSAITLKLTIETVYSPGEYYQILKIIAWRGINIIEIISTYTELTIVFDNAQIEQAFRALKSL